MKPFAWRVKWGWGEERRKMVNSRAVAFPKRSKLSLIDADAWQTRVHSIARAPTEAADRG